MKEGEGEWMHSVNLYSLVQAYKDLKEKDFYQYIRRFNMKERIRRTEIEDLTKLTEQLKLANASAALVQSFYFGYAIQQISKEFDLLRIGTNMVLNVELKRISTKDRVLKQLLQNEYYLRFLNVPIKSFTYVAKQNTLYELVGDELQVVPFERLVHVLQMQHVRHIDSLDDLFDPVHYLISPTERPHAFMDNEYFLTAHQTTFKNEILQAINGEIIGIEGGAGTGKTLLLYDIAKTLIQRGFKTLLVQVNPLQKGQADLIEYYNWRILQLTETANEALDTYDFILMDEVHLIEEPQFELLHHILAANSKRIICYDPQDYFNGSEALHFLEEHFTLKKYEMKVIIRYNKEIYSFINSLFDRRYPFERDYKDISIQYFNCREDAESYMQLMHIEGWKIVDVSTNKLLEESSPKDIIGQEFNQVVALIDNHFYYKRNGRLSCKDLESPHERPIKVLYQAVTRTRKSLKLVIVNNVELMNYVLSKNKLLL